MAAASKREALHGVPDGIACIRISQAALSLDKDLVIMGVYIPPTQSSYSDQRVTNKANQAEPW